MFHGWLIFAVKVLSSTRCFFIKSRHYFKELTFTLIGYLQIGDLLECLKVIDADPDVHVVRIKNRLCPSYQAAQSAGYRDVALNVRIINAETKALGVETHVAEVQLLLKSFAEIKVYCRILQKPLISLIHQNVHSFTLPSENVIPLAERGRPSTVQEISKFTRRVSHIHRLGSWTLSTAAFLPCQSVA